MGSNGRQWESMGGNGLIIFGAKNSPLGLGGSGRQWEALGEGGEHLSAIGIAM